MGLGVDSISLSWLTLWWKYGGVVYIQVDSTVILGQQ